MILFEQLFFEVCIMFVTVVSNVYQLYLILNKQREHKLC